MDKENDIILEILREVKEDTKDNGEKISQLETKLTLFAQGQQDRVKQLTKRVDEIEPPVKNGIGAFKVLVFLGAASTAVIAIIKLLGS